jgi:hypothetical protein
MPTTFHPFPDLTAELRSSIWKFALQNDKAHRNAQAGRAIQLFNYDPSGDTIAVAISIPYPLLFTVSREARYEAAKLDGCKWMTVHTRYRGREGISTYPSFSICMKFSRDLIYIPRNFLKFKQRNAWLGKTETPEHFHIRTLGRLLHPESVCKIQRISVSTPPKGPYNFGDWRELYGGKYPWWRGEGLTLFRRGSLRSVHLFSMKRSHLLWAKLQVENYLQHYWVETDLKKKERPAVTITPE